MSGNFLWALGASVAVSAVSLVGVIGLALKEQFMKRILIYLVAFGAGGLIGSAFLHLLPESLEHLPHGEMDAFVYSLSGFIMFFILEKYLFWRHCHKGTCDVHVFTYLNLFGDGIHNFIDGLIIGASFMADFHLGAVATLSIILHEVPQELSDFGVLVYGGLTKAKALFYNFLSAVTAVAGTAVGYLFASRTGDLAGILIAVAAGGFIYIGGCDLIPEIHRQPDKKNAALSMVCFLAGIALMFFMKAAHEGHAH
jgi:zinc and cadmium transporter